MLRQPDRFGPPAVARIADRDRRLAVDALLALEARLIAHRSELDIEIAPAPIDPARLSHRTLQTMRQAGMQMRRRPRPWPQVLFVGKLPGLAPANGLRPPGVLPASNAVPRQLPPRPRDSGVHLRDQPRTTAPSRATLKSRHARVPACPPRPHRCGAGRRAPRQYARRLARRRPQALAHWGGSR